MEIFVSYRPEPGAWATDAFSLNWSSFRFYCFLPFRIIGKVLAKVQKGKAQGILIVPLWSTQPWFPMVMNLITAPPILIRARGNLLLLPGIPDATFESYGSFFVRTALRNKKIQEDPWALIRYSWRDSTRPQYESVLCK